jgi:hypothetical protein
VPLWDIKKNWVWGFQNEDMAEDLFNVKPLIYIFYSKKYQSENFQVLFIFCTKFDILLKIFHSLSLPSG